jgi:hypothetical protein
MYCSRSSHSIPHPDRKQKKQLVLLNSDAIREYVLTLIATSSSSSMHALVNNHD